MTIDDVLQSMGSMTVDGQGRLANLMFVKDQIVGHIEARLPRDFLRIPDAAIEWTLHWRDNKGMEQRLTSTDLRGLLQRFGPVDLLTTPAQSLDEVLQPI